MHVLLTGLHREARLGSNEDRLPLTRPTDRQVDPAALREHAEIREGLIAWAAELRSRVDPLPRT